MRPAVAPSRELRPRRQKSLLEVTAAEHLTLGERHVAEVPAGRAALKPAEADELPFIDKRPILHSTPDAYVCTTQGQPVLSSVRLTSADAAAPIACRE